MGWNGGSKWGEKMARGRESAMEEERGEVIGFVLQMEGFFVSLCSSIIRNLYT